MASTAESSACLAVSLKVRRPKGVFHKNISRIMNQAWSAATRMTSAEAIILDRVLGGTAAGPLAGDPAGEKRFDESVEIAVENLVGDVHDEPGAVVLHHLIRM